MTSVAIRMLIKFTVELWATLISNGSLHASLQQKILVTISLKPPRTLDTMSFQPPPSWVRVAKFGEHPKSSVTIPVQPPVGPGSRYRSLVDCGKAYCATLYIINTYLQMMTSKAWRFSSVVYFSVQNKRSKRKDTEAGA